MKLLIDITGFLPKKSFGALTFTEGFLRALNMDSSFRKHRIIVLSSNETIGYFKDLTNIEFVELKVPVNPFVRVIYLQFKIAKVFNSIQPDVIFSPLEISYPAKCPSVVYIHDIISKHYIDNHPKYRAIRNNILWRRVKLSIKYSDLVITPSEFTKNEILRFVKVPNPIQVVKEGRPDGDAEYFESEVNFEKNTIFIPSYKALHKPIHQLVEAIKVIKETKPELLADLQLIFTGSKNEETEKLFNSITEIDERIKIVCTGFISGKQINYFYSLAKMVLFITDYEGFGLPMIESDYFGIPIVCTDIPVLREIENDNSIFYEKDNPVDLAEKIVDTLSTGNRYQPSYTTTWEKFNKDIFIHLENLIKKRH